MSTVSNHSEFELEFTVLDSTKTEERTRWIDIWEAWPNQEPVAHPGYLELFAQPGERAVCAVQMTAGGGVMYPFILRSLAALKWAKDSDLWDATGPLWGYTGAFTWGSGAGLSESYWRSFDAWANHQNVISSFTRLSLFQDEILEFNGHRRLLQLNIVRSLNLNEDELWMDFEHKVRKNVNRARRDGVEVAIEHGDEALKIFMNIYTQTMLRRDAPKGFHFSTKFFEDLLSALNPMTKIFIARQRDRPVSVEMVLHSNRHAYSFLGGTLEPDFPSRPNDLLKFELFRWARSEGLNDVVLGGGPIPEDVVCAVRCVTVLCWRKGLRPRYVRRTH
jgi:hypothetical protein